MSDSAKIVSRKMWPAWATSAQESTACSLSPCAELVKLPWRRPVGNSTLICVSLFKYLHFLYKEKMLTLDKNSVQLLLTKYVGIMQTLWKRKQHDLALVIQKHLRFGHQWSTERHCNVFESMKAGFKSCIQALDQSFSSRVTLDKLPHTSLCICKAWIPMEPTWHVVSTLNFATVFPVLRLEFHPVSLGLLGN